MKSQKLTTEDTEKKNFRYFKSSVNLVVAYSQKEFPGFSQCPLWLGIDSTFAG